MSHISNRPLNTDELDLIESLLDLPTSGDNQGIYKSGTTSFSNRTFSGGSASWGTITGTLSNQTDLQTALNTKADKTFAIAMALALG